MCLCVSVFVYPRPVDHTFWPRVLIFGMKDFYVNHSSRIFLLFEILQFDLRMAIFRFLDIFAIYPFLVLKESAGRTK